MPVKISIKHSILILLGALASAVGMVFLLNFMLTGPRLGPHYDFILSRQKPPPVSREILIIETGELIESSDIFSVLLTLTEMDAAYLLLTGRISLTSSPVTLSETEIRRRFIDEYILIGSNIRNLFDAIRSGSVSPVQAPIFVQNLLELTEQGKDRLLAALINRDEDVLRSIAVFANYLEVDTQPVFDTDGKLRRVQPVDMETSYEHPVFTLFKSRYAMTRIETIDEGLILWIRRRDSSEFDIPLDRDGRIITSSNLNFRNINVSLFREYEEAGFSMRTALVRAGELGAFSQILPENSPLFLGDYAAVLREEMLKSPDSETKAAWRKARSNYFYYLDVFLNGQAERNLVMGYDNVIAEEVNLSEEGLAALAKMRDELRQSFASMREEYEKLSVIRALLEEELHSSYAILGPFDNAKYSALLANTMITGSHIKPAGRKSILFWSMLCSSIILLVIFLFRRSILFFCGIVLSVLAAAAFSFLLINYSYWLDPAIVFVSSVTGTLVIFFCKCVVIKYRARRFRIAYGIAVSPVLLKELINSGRPRVSETVIRFAAVIAIKDINLLSREANEKPEDAGGIRKSFFSSVKEIAHSGGAVIAGLEGDTILVCFGTPLDKTINPLNKAISFVGELLNNEKITWRFGIDAGECTFYWTAETGYCANGRPAVFARMLVSKTKRLKARSLITNSIREKLNADIKKIDSVNDNEPIFEFPSIKI